MEALAFIAIIIALLVVGLVVIAIFIALVESGTLDAMLDRYMDLVDYFIKLLRKKD